MAFTSSERARKSALVAAGGLQKARCTLPSPRCPKGKGWIPGTSLLTFALASSMKSGTTATGTETSCAIEPPVPR